MSDGSGITKLTATEDDGLGDGTLRRPKFLLRKKPPKKPKTKIIKRYFTAGHKINDQNQRDFYAEPSPFSYPNDFEAFAAKVLSKAWREDMIKKELAKSAFERTNHNSRQYQDLLNRLVCSP